MRQCPQCGSYFEDDNQFCQNDGSVLFVASSRSLSNEVPTVVFTQPPTPAAQPANSAKWLIPVIGLLGALVVIFGYIAFFRSPPPVANQPPESENKTVVKSSEKAQPTPTKAVSTPQTPTPRERPPIITSRMKFNKGEITHVERGGIADGGQRIFLLKCRYGQTLNASVISDNDCVTFDNDSTSLGFMTVDGDNRINLKNKCGPTNFSVSVTIR
ncbi:MAG: hypothetical protein IPJ30_09540 [Acidobacteria bacterium]|nr:hypothetical protein [Acidobacteriota bacterium]